MPVAKPKPKLINPLDYLKNPEPQVNYEVQNTGTVPPASAGQVPVQPPVAVKVKGVTTLVPANSIFAPVGKKALTLDEQNKQKQLESFNREAQAQEAGTLAAQEYTNKRAVLTADKEADLALRNQEMQKSRALGPWTGSSLAEDNLNNRVAGKQNSFNENIAYQEGYNKYISDNKGDVKEEKFELFKKPEDPQIKKQKDLVTATANGVYLEYLKTENPGLYQDHISKQVHYSKRSKNVNLSEEAKKLDKEILDKKNLNFDLKALNFSAQAVKLNINDNTSFLDRNGYGKYKAISEETNVLVEEQKKMEEQYKLIPKGSQEEKLFIDSYNELVNKINGNVSAVQAIEGKPGFTQALEDISKQGSDFDKIAARARTIVQEKYPEIYKIQQAEEAQQQQLDAKGKIDQGSITSLEQSYDAFAEDLSNKVINPIFNALSDIPSSASGLAVQISNIFSDEYGAANRIHDKINYEIEKFKALNPEAGHYEYANGKKTFVIDLLPQVVGVGTNMGVMIVESLLGVRALSLLSGAEKTTAMYRVATVATGYVQAAHGYYDAGIEAGMTTDQANVFAFAQAGASSLLELVNPEAVFLSRSSTVARRSAAEYMRILAKGGPEAASLAIEGSTKIVLNTVGENGQEMSQKGSDMLISHFTNKILGTNLKVTEDLENDIKNTLVVTTIVSSVVGVGGAVMQVSASKNQLLNDAIFAAAENPDVYKKLIIEQTQEGKLFEKDAAQVAYIVNTAEMAMSRIGNIDEASKRGTLPYMMQKIDLEEQKKKVDPIYHPEIDKKIAELDKAMLVISKTKSDEVAQLRADEQEELKSSIPNIEDYKVDGNVDRNKITDEKVLKKFDKIYDKYDKLISPLLPAKPTQEVKGEVVGNGKAKEGSVDADAIGGKRLVQPEKPISEMNSEELSDYSTMTRKALKAQDKEFEGKTEKEKEDAGYYDYIDDVEDSRDAAQQVNDIENAENINDLSESTESALRNFDKDKPSEYSLAVLNAVKKKTAELNIPTENLIKAVVKRVGNKYQDIDDAETMVRAYLEKLIPTQEVKDKVVGSGVGGDVELKNKSKTGILVNTTAHKLVGVGMNFFNRSLGQFLPEFITRKKGTEKNAEAKDEYTELTQEQANKIYDNLLNAADEGKISAESFVTRIKAVKSYLETVDTPKAKELLSKLNDVLPNLEANIEKLQKDTKAHLDDKAKGGKGDIDNVWQQRKQFEKLDLSALKTDDLFEAVEQSLPTQEVKQAKAGDQAKANIVAKEGETLTGKTTDELPALSKEEREVDDAIENAKRSLASTGIEIVTDPKQVREAMEKDGQKSSHGLFVAKDGKIYLDRERFQKGFGRSIVWHEAAHPVINILRNTNRPLYDKVVAGLKKIRGNEGVDNVIEWAQENYKKERWDDESVVESIAAVGDGRIDPNTLPKSFRQTLINAVNEIAKIFGFDQVLDDTDIGAFKKLAAKVSGAIKTGKDISSIVGKDNVKKLEYTDSKGNVIKEAQSKKQSLSNIDINKVRSKNRPGKKVSKGLSVKMVDGKKVIEETDDLSLEYVKENAPRIFISNANIIAKYPLVAGKKKFQKITTVAQAQEIYDIFIREVANNLNYLMDEFKPEFRDIATLWYDGANSLANDFADKFGISSEQASGIIASMSPQKDWYQNVRLAEMVMMAYKDNPVMTQSMIDYQKTVNQKGLYVGEKSPDKKLKKAEKAYKKSRTKLNKEALEEAKVKMQKAIVDADAIISMLGKYIGKKLNDTPQYVQPYMVRTYHELNTTKDYNIIAPDGSVQGVAKKKDGSNAKVAWGSYSEIGKAVSIINDGSQENITKSLGQMHKIRNFHNNIIDPMSKDGDVTMDTHAIAAALLLPLSGNSIQVGQNFGTGTSNSGPLGIKGLYYAYAEGYALAAKEAGLLPRQIQSITWEAVRGLYTDTFKKDKNSVEKINNIWKNYENGKITVNEARKQSKEAAGGIKDPTWAGGPIQEESGGSVGQEGIGTGSKGDGRDIVGGKLGGDLEEQSQASTGERKQSLPKTVAGVTYTELSKKRQDSLREDRSKKEYFDDEVKAMKKSKLSDEELKRIVKDEDFGILTGQNPDNTPTKDDVNEKLNKKAEEWISEKGYTHHKVTGRYNQTENSFLVPGLTADHAVEFAKEFNQESVVTNEGLIYQDGTMNPREKESDSFDVDVSLPDANYASAVRTKDGSVKGFSVGIDFDGPKKKSSANKPNESQASKGERKKTEPDTREERVKKINDRFDQAEQNTIEALRSLKLGLVTPEGSKVTKQGMDLEDLIKVAFTVARQAVIIGGDIKVAIEKTLKTLRDTKAYQNMVTIGSAQDISIGDRITDEVNNISTELSDLKIHAGAKKVLADKFVNQEIKDGLIEKGIEYRPKTVEMQSGDAKKFVEFFESQGKLEELEELIYDDNSGLTPTTRVNIATELLSRYSSKANAIREYMELLDKNSPEYSSLSKESNDLFRKAGAMFSLANTRIGSEAGRALQAQKELYKMLAADRVDEVVNIIRMDAEATIDKIVEANKKKIAKSVKQINDLWDQGLRGDSLKRAIKRVIEKNLLKSDIEGVDGLVDQVYDKLSGKGSISATELSNRYRTVLQKAIISDEAIEGIAKHMEVVKLREEQKKLVDEKINDYREALEEASRTGVPLTKEEVAFHNRTIFKEWKALEKLDLKAQEAIEKASKPFKDPRDFYKTLTGILKMRLLSPLSLFKNISGYLPYVFIHPVLKVPSSVMDWAYTNTTNLFRGDKVSRSQNFLLDSIGYKTYGFPFAFREAVRRFWTGKTNPNIAELDTTSGLNSVDAWKDIFRHRRAGERGYVENKISAILEAISPDADMISRLLAAPDVLVRKIAERGAVFSMAKNQNLSGPDLWDAIINPPKEVKEVAEEIGARAAYQNKNEVAKLLDDIGNKTDSKYIGRHIKSLAKFLLKEPNIPFVTTPINIVSAGIKLTMWPVSLAAAVWNIKKSHTEQEKGNKVKSAYYRGRAIESFSMMGFALAAGSFALEMLLGGALTGAADKEDKDIKSESYQHKHPNSLNYSAVLRKFAGNKDWSTPALNSKGENTDTWIHLAGLGPIGVAFSVHANVYQSMDVSERNDTSLSWNTLSGIEAIPAAVRSTLDQTYLAGAHNLMDAIFSQDPKGTFMTNYLKTISTTFLPNTLSAMSRSSSEYMRDTKGGSVGDRFKAGLKERLFMGDELPTKVTVWGSPVSSLPPGTNKYAYYFLDPFQSYNVNTQSFKYLLFDFYNNTGIKTIIPTAPGNKIVINKEPIELSPKEYEEYQTIVGKMREAETEKYVLAGDFKTDDQDTRVATLNSIYDGTKEQAKRTFIMNNERLLLLSGGMESSDPREMLNDIRSGSGGEIDKMREEIDTGALLEMINSIKR